MNDYFKITEIQKMIDIEKKLDSEATITHNYIQNLETFVKLMKEAQESEKQEQTKLRLKDIDDEIDLLEDIYSMLFQEKPRWDNSLIMAKVSSALKLATQKKSEINSSYSPSAKAEISGDKI